VTLVAVDAVVHVSTDARVTEIRRVIVPMAPRALEHRIVIRIGVAGGTDAVGAAVIQREVRVIEGRPCPCRGRMARRAGRREPGRLVVRIRRGGILRLVTRIAIHRNRRVVVVHVAIGARHGRVCTRQWERCVVVVERGRYPRGRVVANIALLWEA